MTVTVYLNNRMISITRGLNYAIASNLAMEADRAYAGDGWEQDHDMSDDRESTFRKGRDIITVAIERE